MNILRRDEATLVTLADRIFIRRRRQHIEVIPYLAYKAVSVSYKEPIEAEKFYNSCLEVINTWYFRAEVYRTNLEAHQRVISPETPLCTYDR